MDIVKRVCFMNSFMLDILMYRFRLTSSISIARGEMFWRDARQSFSVYVRWIHIKRGFVYVFHIFPSFSFNLLVSSNINEVIRAVLNSLYFFTKGFRTHRKHQKHHQKHKKHQEHKKHKNATKQKYKTLQANKNKKCA